MIQSHDNIESTNGSNCDNDSYSHSDRDYDNDNIQCHCDEPVLRYSWDVMIIFGVYWPTLKFSSLILIVHTKYLPVKWH